MKCSKCPVSLYHILTRMYILLLLYALTMDSGVYLAFEHRQTTCFWFRIVQRSPNRMSINNLCERPSPCRKLACYSTLLAFDNFEKTIFRPCISLVFVCLLELLQLLELLLLFPRLYCCSFLLLLSTVSKFDIQNYTATFIVFCFSNSRTVN